MKVWRNICGGKERDCGGMNETNREKIYNNNVEDEGDIKKRIIRRRKEGSREEERREKTKERKWRNGR